MQKKLSPNFLSVNVTGVLSTRPGRVLLPLLVAVVALVVVLLLMGNSLTAYAADGIHYVAPTGADSAACTLLHPCLTIQQAITNAVSGDEIRVAAGVYTTINNLGSASQVVYLNKSLTLRGGFTLTNWLESDPLHNPTIIDAQSAGRGIYIPDPVTVVIEGFHVRKGYVSDGMGAGVDNEKGYLTLRNCEIYENEMSSINSADVGGGIGSGYGTNDATLILENSRIYSNTANSAGGAAIGVVTGTAVLNANRIFGNSTNYGAISVLNEAVVTLQNNWIYANSASVGGGAVFIMGSGDLSIINNTLYKNDAASYGGALYAMGGTTALTNTLLVSNTAVSGGAIYTSGGTLSVTYCDFFGNDPDDYTPPTGQNNRTTKNPDFADPGTYNLHLSSGSPAIDNATSLSTVTSDVDGNGRPFGAGFDRGADEYTAAAPCYARLNAGQVYTSVQMAVNASISDTDVVKIAGYCAGAQPHGTVTQTVYLSRSLTLRGGYTVTDWLTPRYGPTVLDAQNQGRVLYAGGASELSLTIENLHLTGGNAPSGGSGGGIYFDSNVDATVRNNVIYRNQADYRGGGIYNDGVAVLRHNTIYSNTASADGWASAGGGVYNNGNLTLQNNILFSNRAKAYGGGIYKRNASVVTGDYNDFYANTPDDYGNVAAGAHDLALPPHLADAEGGDFHLADASRLVNAADPASTLTKDFEYDVRPWVSRSDIGADESRFYTAVDLGAGLPVATRLITTAEFEAMKGQPVTFTHKFTNTGYTSALTDTFDVTATNLGGWDWTPAGDFSAITLDFSEQHTFTVVVTIPTTVTQGFYNQTLITVTSQTNPATFDTTVDAIANPGMVLTPTYQENADPGEVLTYTHTLTNTGPSDVFTITVSSSLAWGEKLTPTEPVTLAHGESTGIVVRVEVPSKAPANLADIMEVRAASQNFGISAVVTDTTTANATAGDRYVATGGSDTNNNCTQMDSPCKTILHAVQQTAWGDTVFVASGEYVIGGELAINQGINLRGDCTFDVDKNEVIFPDEIDPSATVMDFGGTSRGIHISAAAGAHPWIDGFTIKGASTAGVGGSVYIKSSAPTLSHLLLLDSQASKGGGVYIEAGQPILQDIVISNTVATGGGGALYNESGNATVQRVEIRNSAAQGGHGGGIYNEGGVLSVWNTFIYSNTATWGGGGLYNQGTLRLINDTFYGNQAATYGGGLFENGGSLVISNTIVVSNTATTGGGVYRAGAGALSADYNDIWSNTANSIPQSNLPGGTHDMAADPLFVDTATGDLHLIFDSPCLDTGDPHTFLTGDIDGELRPSNQGFDIGADEIAGCLARVVNPSSGEPVSPIFGSVQEAVDFAPVDYLVQVSGICRGAQPRWVGGQWISQTLLITKSLTVEGGYLPTFDEEERDPNPTILDAQGLGRVLVVTAPTTQVVSVKVTTMTLRGGDASAMTNGGGVYLDKGTLQLERLIISENHATHGGGLYNHSGQLTLGEVAVLSNTASLRGGGLYNVGNTFTISHTRFFSNTAASTGGGIYNYNTGSLDVRSSIVLSNTAASGGGIYNTNALTLVNTLVAGNAVTSNGGGLYNDDLALVVRHVTFYANHAANRGGGIYHDSSSTQPLINSTLLVSNTANAAVDAGGGIYSADADPAFDYNNVYGNTPSNYGGSLLPGDGQGNMAADPEFVSFDPTSLDFLHIPEGSPVEDEGDPASPILVDIDEAPRPSNQNFDIGADEVGDCYIRINGELPTYGSPQLAVDHSQSGDVLYVAGTCRGVRAAQHGAQTLYQSLFLTKSIGIQGGYSPQDWTEPQPSVYTTTIDALAAGRVVYLTDSAVVTMAGLQLRGGYAAAGGGALFIDSGVFTMTNCAVYSSTAAHGGAFYNYDGTAYLDG
ncbi:MAG: hypothetical protein J7M17_08680, partial [Anaerolineae bacterium]|nr:hypothetical protein [Anaerolineae bacterium]